MGQPASPGSRAVWLAILAACALRPTVPATARSPATQQPRTAPYKTLAPWAVGEAESHAQSRDSFCLVPRLHVDRESEANAPALTGSLEIEEVEPNSLPSTAQALPLGFDIGQSMDVDIAGSVAPANDVDYFSFTAAKGDVLGAAAIGAGAPDTVLALTSPSGLVQLENDDHQGLANAYPQTSPFPGGETTLDSAISFVFPADGHYLLRISSYEAIPTSGPYVLRVRIRKPAVSLLPPLTTQKFFLDFDGATINAEQVFGGGATEARLSPFSTFLPAWGLAPSAENALIDQIIEVFEQNFDALRTETLNGDRDIDGVNGHFDFEVLNSRDHPDPAGDPDVSRVIIGGTAAELGIATIGLAQSVDPGNFETSETAVVLLDVVSGPGTDPFSVNSLLLGPGATINDAVARVVGEIAAHEVGHLLGSWHTDKGNTVRCLMDAGGQLDQNIAGVGPDGVFGTSDDVDPQLNVDEYEPGEGIGRAGIQRTNVRTAFGLSTGGGSGPDNDACVAATCIVDGAMIIGTNEGATVDGMSGCASGDQATVWYAYTPRDSAIVTLSLCGSSFDTELAVYTACGAPSLDCNDNACGAQSQLSIPMTAGETYLIRVGGIDGAAGPFLLHVEGGGGTCEACLPESVIAVEATIDNGFNSDAVVGDHTFGGFDLLDSVNFPGEGFTVDVSSGPSLLPDHDWFVTMDFNNFDPEYAVGGVAVYTLSGLNPAGAMAVITNVTAQDGGGKPMPGEFTTVSDSELVFENGVDQLVDAGKIISLHWAQTCPVPPCDLVAGSPPDCTIDARQPHDVLDAGVRFGVDTFTLTFDCSGGGARPLGPDDYAVTSSAQVAPDVSVVEPVANNGVRVILDGPIPPLAWTCLEVVASGERVCLGYLPADANGDRVASPSDILAVVDALNGIAPLPMERLDMDRSGEAGPSDILRVIDLLNGAGAFEPYLDRAIGACP